MAFQTGIIKKGLETVCAHKWFFSCVCSTMVGKREIPRKGLGAKLALKWLFTSVCLVMHSQI
ncbi:unnamed protein product [Ixodes pacificus]